MVVGGEGEVRRDCFTSFAMTVVRATTAGRPYAIIQEIFKKFLMGGGYESIEVGGSSDFCFPFGSPGCNKSAAGVDESFLLEDS